MTELTGEQVIGRNLAVRNAAFMALFPPNAPPTESHVKTSFAYEGPSDFHALRKLFTDRGEVMPTLGEQVDRTHYALTNGADEVRSAVFEALKSQYVEASGFWRPAASLPGNNATIVTDDGFFVIDNPPDNWVRHFDGPVLKVDKRILEYLRGEVEKGRESESVLYSEEGQIRFGQGTFESGTYNREDPREFRLAQMPSRWDIFNLFNKIRVVPDRSRGWTYGTEVTALLGGKERVQKLEEVEGILEMPLCFDELDFDYRCYNTILTSEIRSKGSLKLAHVNSYGRNPHSNDYIVVKDFSSE